MMNKRNSIIVAVVICVALAAYYREEVTTFVREGLYSLTAKEQDLTNLHEVSATTTYTVPNGEDTETYSLYLDDNGVIVAARATAEGLDGEAQAHLNEFAHELTKAIKGKKLSELGAIDKVGSSSLTTAAFNSVLAELQSQI